MFIVICEHRAQASMAHSPMVDGMEYGRIDERNMYLCMNCFFMEFFRLYPFSCHSKAKSINKVTFGKAPEVEVKKRHEECLLWFVTSSRFYFYSIVLHVGDAVKCNILFKKKMMTKIVHMENCNDSVDFAILWNGCLNHKRDNFHKIVLSFFGGTRHVCV